MIKSFSVKNYRNLEINELELGRINLLVGPNNSGKSNFMRALSFFSDMMSSQKGNHGTAFRQVMHEHGWDAVLKRDIEKPGNIEMKLVFNTEEKYSDFGYRLEFKVDKGGQTPGACLINQEEFCYEPSGNLEDLQIKRVRTSVTGYYRGNVLMVKKGTEVETNTYADSYETIFRQIERMSDDDKFRMSVFPQFKKLANILDGYFRGFRQYTCNDFNLKAVSEPLDLALTQQFLKENGADFVNVLSYLDAHYNFLDDYTDRLRELIPNLKRIKFLHIGNKVQMQLIVNNQTFHLSEMSYGTIQAMLLTLLLWTPEKMSILAMDEPEINLHPAWDKVIGDWATKSPSAKQLFISTHSPDFLDRFTELYRQGEVALFTFQLNQQPTVKRVYPDKLDIFFQQGWELGDLYRVGEPELGGWPW